MPVTIASVDLSSLPTTNADLVSIVTGYVLDIYLLGALTVQAYNYFISFPEDRWLIKQVVAVVFLIECVITGLGLYNMSCIALQTFLDLTTFRRHVYIEVTQAILATIVTFITQCFYIYRIYLISRNHWLVTFIFLTSFVQVGIAIAIAIRMRVQMSILGVVEESIFGLAVCLFGFAAVCDIVIAVSMVILLARNDTGLSSTRRLVKRVTRLTIESGTVTAVVALLCLALFAAYPRHYYFAVLSTSLDKWYSNTLFAQLNNRARHAGRDDHSLAFVTFNSSVERRHRSCKYEDTQSSQQAIDETRS